jgi:CRISPR-associated endonuclease/helicase Cas3
MMWNLATETPPNRTVIFIEKPEDAATFRSRLEAAGLRTALLTGTMRGYERDNLVLDDTFKRFLQKECEDGPVWLVSTSAGEVGLNLTCERMITGLVEADHLLQRFGRLNRFGSGTGEAHVVYAPPGPKEARLASTIDYLRKLKGDISCKNIWNNRPSEEAQSERPVLARLEPWRIECWAQTCNPDMYVAAVAPWLHGKQDVNAPETELAWRDEVEVLTRWGISPAQIEQILDRYPISAAEIIREPATRVVG